MTRRDDEVKPAFYADAGIRYRSAKAEKAIGDAMTLAQREGYRWECEWVGKAWLRKHEGVTVECMDANWEWFGEPADDITDIGKWPPNFTQYVHGMIPGWHADPAIQLMGLLEACNVEVEDEEVAKQVRSRWDKEAGSPVYRADLEKGLAQWFSILSPKVLSHSAWDYGGVRSRVYKAGQLAEEAFYPLDEVGLEERFGTEEYDWFRSLCDAVVLAHGIIATWTQPIYNVRSEYELDRKAKQRVRDVMTTRVKEWAQAQGLLHWHAATHGKGRLAEIAHKWALQHAPTQLETDEWRQLKTRLDYTLALSFVLKWTQQEHTEVSFVSLLNRDMREHLAGHLLRLHDVRRME